MQTNSPNDQQQPDHEAAKKLVRRYTFISTSTGLIPFPLLDLVALTGLHLKMVHSLSKHYQQPFSGHVGKAAIGALVTFATTQAGGRFASRFAGSLVKSVPIVGVLAGMGAQTLTSGILTMAIGNTFLMHFAAGGTVLNFDPEKMKAHFLGNLDESQKELQRVSWAGVKP